MTKDVDALLESIRKLPREEREELIASAALELERERDVESGVAAEIERRAFDAIKNPGKGISIEEAFRRIDEALDARVARKGNDSGT